MLAFLIPLPVLPHASAHSQTLCGFPQPMALPALPARPRRARPSPRCRPVSATAGPPSDPYRVLDVSPDADAAAIKRAYRRAALKNHPDVSSAPDARERFLQVQDAYAILSDPSRRAAYDRRRRVSDTVSGFPGFSDSGFDSSFADAAEFANRWKKENPMPNDLEDNFSSIFSDLFSGVADAVGSSASSGGGVVEDFIDFLEKRVDGFSSSPSSTSSSSARNANPDDDVLKSRDLDVLTAEIDDARFVLDQLNQRKRKAQREEDALRQRARDWGQRAERAEKRRDVDTREAARIREDELMEEALRFARRVDESSRHIRQQRDRLEKLEKRLAEVRTSSSPTSSSSSSQTQQRDRGNSSTSTDQNGANSRTQTENIDDELQKMKRELGL